MLLYSGCLGVSLRLLYRSKSPKLEMVGTGLGVVYANDQGTLCVLLLKEA